MNDVAFSKHIYSLDNINHLSCSDILYYFYQSAVINLLPIALWRLPRSKNKHALVNFSSEISPVKLDFSKNTSGFAFSPFRNDTGNSTIFIKSGILLNCSEKVFYEEDSASYSDNELSKRAKFIKTFNNLINNPEEINHIKWLFSDKDVPVIYTQDEYCNLVNIAVKQIKSSKIKKIVTSRAQSIELPKGFNPVKTFDDLSAKYPDAFVSLVSIPGVGTWLGASPETLLKFNNTGITTMALAGTQPKIDNVSPHDVKWTPKEIEEQTLVAKYIRDCFKSLGEYEFEEKIPKTIAAGNVVHLQSLFKQEMELEKTRRFATRLLSLLHPTPAICGLPKNEALSFILEHELHNREFYSGFLGPVNINNESALFVNLRCMQLREKTATLYVGGGLTADSIPEKEWNETVLKAETLLSLLK